eukprot:SM000052S17679  [mRNA]  locus=s52:18386:21667:- [translate_table: standard]
MEALRRLKALDAYPKVNEDFHSRTLSGGIITLASSAAMAALFLNELLGITPLRHASDGSVWLLPSEVMPWRGCLWRQLDVTFPRISCASLSLDAMDISGEQHLDVVHNIFKRRLSEDGKPINVGIKHGIGRTEVAKLKHKDGREVGHNETHCGSCYGAEENPDDCCNTCDEVRDAYRNRGWAFSNAENIEQVPPPPQTSDCVSASALSTCKSLRFAGLACLDPLTPVSLRQATCTQCVHEGYLDNIKSQEGEGCNIYGLLEVNKVAGNFHFSASKSLHTSMQIHSLLPSYGGHDNDVHSSGNIFAVQLTHKVNSLSFGAHFPGILNPLDNAEWIQVRDIGMYQYFIKVVPTIYTDLRGHAIPTNQAWEHFRPSAFSMGQAIPGVFFFYDLSPIKVKFMETRTSFLHFVTNVCAIVGGVFTVSGIIDAFVYHGHKAIKKKMEIGKLS